MYLWCDLEHLTPTLERAQPDCSEKCAESAASQSPVHRAATVPAATSFPCSHLPCLLLLRLSPQPVLSQTSTVGPAWQGGQVQPAEPGDLGRSQAQSPGGHRWGRRLEPSRECQSPPPWEWAGAAVLKARDRLPVFLRGPGWCLLHSDLPFAVSSSPWPKGCTHEGWMGSTTTRGECAGAGEVCGCPSVGRGGRTGLEVRVPRSAQTQWCPGQSDLQPQPTRGET